MSLTVGMFEACVAEMGSLRASRILDGAQAAQGAQAGQDWWDSLLERAQGAGRATAQVAGFSLNGIAMGFDRLKTQLGRLLGGGLSE